MIKVLPAWKAVRSEATVTGDEVLGSQVIANICLEGSTPVNAFCFCLLWRSATSLRFSAALGNSSKLDCLACTKIPAHRFCIAYPSTSCPVTVATLRSAFQALSS